MSAHVDPIDWFSADGPVTDGGEARIHILLDDGDADVAYEQDLTAVVEPDDLAELADDACLEGETLEKVQSLLRALAQAINEERWVTVRMIVRGCPVLTSPYGHHYRLVCYVSGIEYWF